MNTLFINACIRKDESRTLFLAQDLLSKINHPIIQIDLQQTQLQPLDCYTLIKRNTLLKQQKYDDDMFQFAHQFANADNILIATPYWDLGFPAILKIYLEHIAVPGITFKYDDCRPVGLCKAQQLTYVTTAGGIIHQDFGYSYVKALANNLFGIPNVCCYKSENLDIEYIDKEDLFQLAPPQMIK